MSEKYIDQINEELSSGLALKCIEDKDIEHRLTIYKTLRDHLIFNSF